MPDRPPSSSLRGVLAALQHEVARGEASVLAVVLATSGSTYRKPGAIALVTAGGNRHGVISGGCLEADLERLAAAALQAGEPRTVTFDTQGDDDVLFGSGTGCRGRMQVLALPLRPGRDDAVLQAVLALDDGGQPVRIACRATASHVLTLTVACGAQQWPFAMASSTTNGAPTNSPDAAITHDVSLAPALRLLLLGAGPEAPPLARIARALGWHVSIVDHRPALANATRLPDADRLVVARPAAALAQWSDDTSVAAIAMTHSASTDLEALRALAPRRCRYIGLLGPPRRRDELMAQLDTATREAIAPRLRAPVGLALGGEGPEAIALAIAADLQREFAPR